MRASTGMKLLHATVLAVLLSVANASHFRYGTLAWKVSNYKSDLEIEFEFTFKAAFRRDYSWGRFFDEYWAQTTENARPTDLDWSKVAYDESSCTAAGFEWDSNVGKCINKDPQFDRQFDTKEDTNDNGKIGEKFYIRFPPKRQQDGKEVVICPDPFTCDVSTTTVRKKDQMTYFGEAFNGHLDPSDQWDYVPDHSYLEATSYPPGAVQDPLGNFGISNGNNKVQHDLCMEFDTNPEMDPSKCADWTNIYGFYFGDDSSAEIEMTVDKMDDSPNNILGNYLMGTSNFGHTYTWTLAEREKKDRKVAFFTGGNRIFECAYTANAPLSPDGRCIGDLDKLLNNNGEGRYRLEIEVWAETDAINNYSPVASQIPVLPQPRVSVEDFAKNDQIANRRKFQIAAYDLNPLDILEFRFGNMIQRGGVVGSKMDAFPWSSHANISDTDYFLGHYPNRLPHRQAVGPLYNASGSIDITTGMRQFQTDGCRIDSGTLVNERVCPYDRHPVPVIGTTRWSFRSKVPGLVEWNTWKVKWTEEAMQRWEASGRAAGFEFNAEEDYEWNYRNYKVCNYDDYEADFELVCDKLPVGLYNMVVMIKDSNQYVNDFSSETQVNTAAVSIPLDFMLYLFEGPLNFCNRNCKDNKMMLPVPNSPTPYEAPTNACTDNRNASGSCGNPGTNYNALYAGVPTFADRDGIYGAETIIDADHVQSQSCTICGMGTSAGSDAMFSCTPYDDDASVANLRGPRCGISLEAAKEDSTAAGNTLSDADLGFTGVTSPAGTSIVPADTACTPNTPPRFTSDGFITSPAGREWEDTPGLDVYERNVYKSDHPLNCADLIDVDFRAECETSGDFQIPEIRELYGEDIGFWVTVIDTDDCVELSLDTVGLPQGYEVGKAESYFREAEYLSNYPEFPEGQKVRRLFEWPAPSTDPVVDQSMRPPVSQVCFYGTDKYLYTVKPFYCVRIVLEPPPEPEEESLVRFDCKLALNWHPGQERFVVHDEGTKYYSNCTFEHYMWHHAMISIDDEGFGHLYVDGEPQILRTDHTEQNPEGDIWKGVEGDGDSTRFKAKAYANKMTNECRVPGATPAPTQAPTQAPTPAPVASGVTDRSRRLLNVDSTPDPKNGYWPIDPPDGRCCSFKILHRCPDETDDHFEGFGDEIAVWNRVLSEEEIENVMFKMPQYLPVRKLEANRGVQMDLTAGRVLWARFNNPCMEGPLPPPPPASVTPDAGSAKRRLSQLYSITEAERNKTDANNLHARRPGVSDHSGWTSGFVAPDGTTTINTDKDVLQDFPAGFVGEEASNNPNQGNWDRPILRNGVDTISFIEPKVNNNYESTFPAHTKYVYTGVPWAPPHVMKVSGGPAGNTYPIDGGVEVTMKGVGFAKSPFSKCVVAQPDTKGHFDSMYPYQPRPIVDGEVYNEYFRNADGTLFSPAAPFVLDESHMVTTTPATMKMEQFIEMSRGEDFMNEKGEIICVPDDVPGDRNNLMLCPRDDVEAAYKGTWLNPQSFRHPSNFKRDYDPSAGAVRNAWNSCLPAVGGFDVDRNYCPSNKTCDKTRGCNVNPFEVMYRHRHLEKLNEGDKYVEYSAAPWSPDNITLPRKNSLTYASYNKNYGSEEGDLADDKYNTEDPGKFATAEYIYGSWETATCDAPAQAFVSDRYLIGFSNDGGIIAGAASQVTYSEVALKLDGDTTATLTPTLSGVTFTAWMYLENGPEFDNNTVIMAWQRDDSGSADLRLEMSSTEVTFLDGNEVKGSMPIDDMSALEGLWHTVVVIVDGDSLTVMIDFDSFVSDKVTDAKYSLFEIGRNFEGRFDEIKVFSTNIGASGAVDAVASDSSDAPDVGLLNFNDMSNTGVTCSPVVCSQVSSHAPWQPTSMYTLNGDDIDDVIAGSASMTGGEELTISGFNIAPSATLQCMWGKSNTNIPSKAVPENEPMSMACPVGEGSLDRPDGVTFTKHSSNLTILDDEFSTEATVVSCEGESCTATCKTPGVDQPLLVDFGIVGAATTLNTVPFEFTEVALECDGVDDFVDASSVAATLDATNGYSFSMWVFPYEDMVHRSEAEEGSPMIGRKLMSQEGEAMSDKLGRRRGLLSAEKNETTVLAFEMIGSEVQNSALLMYDGARFFYYDDCILDVTTSSEAGSKPGEWHYVTVTVDAEGEGSLYVDGRPAETFTTVCKPETGGNLTLCADMHRNSSVPTSFFYGLVDQVAVYSKALSKEDIESFMFSATAFHAADDLVGGFTFNDTEADYVYGVNGDMAVNGTKFNGAMSVKSTAPWHPAMVGSIEPTTGDVNGGSTVTMLGANFAPSQWLRANFGGASVRPEELVPFGMVAKTTKSETKTCDEQIGPKVMNNDGDPNSGLSSASYKYLTTTMDLQTGLEAYYTMDSKVSHNTADGFTGLFDQSGHGRDGKPYPAIYAAEDRDHYKKAAFIFGPDMEDGTITVPAPAEYITSEDWTVSVWIFIDYPAAGEQQKDFPVGGWKLVTHVMSGENGTLYVNYEVVEDEDEFKFYVDMFIDFYATGHAFTGVTGKIDELWVYNRALSPCEVAARYFTNEYALDFTKGQANATLPTFTLGGDGMPDMSIPGSLPHMISAWVYPYSTYSMFTEEPVQTIIASEAYALGVQEQRLVFSVKVVGDVHCEPASQYREFMSWKARILPNRWSHVAVMYDGASTWMMVDGVLLDREVYSDGVKDAVGDMSEFHVGMEGKDAIHHPLFAAPDDVRIFNGLMQDLRVGEWSPAGRSATAEQSPTGDDEPMVAVKPYEVNEMVRCPPKDTEGDYFYFGLDEGAGSKVFGLANPINHTIHDIDLHMWTNTSFDDPTHPDPKSTLVLGPGKEGTTSQDIGMYTVTTHTCCLKKRMIGGDNVTVAMTASDDSVTLANVQDTNDGNYHISYENLACGVYDTTVMIDDEIVDGFETKITPSATSNKHTKVVETKINCAGTLATIYIQAMDAYGCKEVHGNSTWQVTIRGPHDPVAHVSYVPNMGDGMYAVTFVPEVAGNYHAEILMGMPDGTMGGPISMEDPAAGSFHCLEVCKGTSLSFSGDDTVEVIEDENPDTNLDLASDGMAMEAWVYIDYANWKEDAESDNGYIVFKGSMDQANEDAFVNVKGYSMYVDTPNGNLTASVYAGEGDLREVSLDLGDDCPSFCNKWVHVAASYTGRFFTLYINGMKEAEEDFVSYKPLKPNDYYHPLQIGYGFTGLIDQVTLWKVGRSAAEVLGNMYCPPFSQMEDVAAFFSFNENDDSGKALGYGDGCRPGSDAAKLGGCLSGLLTRYSNSTEGSTEGPTYSESSAIVEDTSVGVGVPSAERTTSIPAKVTAVYAGDSFKSFRYEARDQCGYKYSGGNTGSFQAVLTKVSMNYFSDDGPEAGIEYPVTILADPLAPVPSQGLPGTCEEGGNDAGPDAEYVSNDIQTQTTNVVEAGMYRMDITDANGRSFTDETMTVEVLADAPASVATFEAADSFEAGVPAAVYVTVQDVNNNKISICYDMESKVMYTHESEAKLVPSYVECDDGEYMVVFQTGYPADYTVSVDVEGIVEEKTVTVTPASWRKVYTGDMDVPLPTRRFEHTTAVNGDDIYIFGGALSDKTYSNQVWVMDSSDSLDLAYLKKIDVATTGSNEEDSTVMINVNTKELIAAGRMNKECKDVIFTEPNNGKPMDYYIYPLPGCDSEDTLIYVRVPAGMFAGEGATTLEMYYGDLSVTENSYNNASAVFDFYAGFEGGSMSTLSPVEPCVMTPTSETTYSVSEQLARFGDGALYSAHGGASVLKADLPKELDAFMLKAWFWDSDAKQSAHFISPDFGNCTATCTQGKPLLPEGGPLEARSTAVGTYTLSSPGRYAVASNWRAGSVPRNANWHYFEVVSSPEIGLKVYVDGEIIKEEAVGITANKVMLSAGYGVDSFNHKGIRESHAFWDEITVMAIGPAGHVPVTAPAMDEDEAVMNGVDAPRHWYLVDIKGSTPPPPRYSHSSVVYNDKMYIFGGERSAFAFNDVWEFDFETSEWSYVTPKSAAAPEPRFDHTAQLVVVDETPMMVIYGGRSGHRFLDDIWALNLETMEWTESPNTGADAVFGHAAATVEGDMYVFGGYTESGFSSKFLKCAYGIGCEDITDTCGGLPEGLVARYSHTMASDGEHVYVYGGSSLEDTDGFSGVYMFDAQACAWEKLEIAGEGVGRYEHVMGIIGNSLYIQGGHSAGHYVDAMYTIPIPSAESHVE